MPSVIWRKITNDFTSWRVATLPAITIIALVIVARLTGSLQFLEWITLDAFLRLRPREALDERIVIIGINETDIQSLGTYPIPDQEMAILLRKLQSYQPRAIGFDIVRDIPVQPGHAELVGAFKDIKNLIAIEKVLPIPINPPPSLPPKQLGFSDVIVDADGNFRRSLLVIPTKQGYKFSLPLRLAEIYLDAEGITLENGINDPLAVRFGKTEMPRLFSNSGGYVLPSADGVQTLLNFRNSQKSFRTLSLQDIKRGNFNPSWIRDRIVLIGITAPSVNDIINTSAVANLKPPGQIYGVEFHAHIASQIISAIKDGRPLLKVWSDGWEYLWIVGWGIVAIAVGQLTYSPLKNLLSVSLASLILVIVSYSLITWGWWIPFVPALIILILIGLGLSALHQHDRALKSEIEIRQRTIEETFNVIHNGPLQTLAYVMRGVRDGALHQDQLLAKLENLNHDIREVGEHLKLESQNQEKLLLLGSGFKLELDYPINELLYTVYRETLERDFPNFKTLKIKVINFEAIDSYPLSIEIKREICQFIEEALCNVGKHAKGATRLKVTGTLKDDWYSLCVQDNGSGISSSSQGRGTKQCQNLAKQLKGIFKRESVSPKGTLCELTWSLTGKKWNRMQPGAKLRRLLLVVSKKEKSEVSNK